MRTEPAAAGVAPQQSSLLPTLAVPKGGGAIRGIGEKLAPNLATGTSSLTIPLTLSPGRAGFEPQLELRYDSAAGNGPFGVGIQLTVPSITRKTGKGLPRYLDDPEHGDVFVLSGAEDLVPARTSAALDAPLDASDRGEYRVERYRPRVEGMFARIERWTLRSTGDVHWRATTRENVVSVYGRSGEARIYDPDDTAHVFSWLLEETRDDRGNVCRYRYKAEDGFGVPVTRLSETSRFRSDGTFAATAQRYLKRVCYGNRSPVPLGAPAPDDDAAWLFEAVFDYGEHDAVAPTTSEQAPWLVRTDPFSSYRSTFEVRTYRRCERVLMFHRFAELGNAPCLVRSTDFAYAESHVRSATNAAYDGGTVITQLASVTHAGYIRDAATNQYTRKILPPLTLGFSQPVIHDAVQIIDRNKLDGLPGTGGAQWVDLDGEGIPGLLAATPRAWYYQENLGHGELGAPLVQRSLPVPAELGDGTMQLVDLAGDGPLDLVRFAAPLAGFFERTEDRSWHGFIPLRQLPNLDWRDPNLRFVDLDGDGLPDLLVTEEDAFCWHRSRGEAGFEGARRLATPPNETLGPAIVFADGTESMHLADMSGDGLVDLVRIRNEEVCYWPNLGHGRFGRKVTLDNVSGFDAPDQFDPRRIRIGDIDGSGTSDLVYLARDGARLYFNLAGNALSPPLMIRSLPPLDSFADLALVDVLGHGTACLVWSTPAPAFAEQPVAFVELLAAGKPHLLVSLTNNLGGEVRIAYSPSTRYYLEDKAAGRPWLTRLPFPVHVIDHVDHIDHVSGSTLVSRFRYHHGYYDGHERELRGFALVEQWDAESFVGPSNNDLVVPPVHTKTWFHTGAWLDRVRLEHRLADEYYRGDPNAPITASAELPAELTTLEEREAVRALRGQVLRQEVYADDATERSEHPYVVTQTNTSVRVLQRATGAASAVFHVVPQQAVTTHYERNPADPRVLQELALEVDEYGNVLRSCSLAYPRRVPAHAEQARLFVTSTKRRVSNRVNDPDWYRIGVLVDEVRAELTGLTPAATGILTIDAVRAALVEAVEISYEQEPSGTVLEARVFAHTRQLYYRDDLAGALPLGTVESRALPFRTLRLAFTQGLLSSVYGNDATATVLAEAGYVEQDSLWWSASSRPVFDPTRFYLPVREIDPYNNSHRVEYDTYGLLPVVAIDALGNTTTAAHDYRVLTPAFVTDPNLNRIATAFDPLGLAVATAVMGKQGANEGDTLADPTTRIEYDLLRWQASGGTQPAFVRTLAREQHSPATATWQETYSYSDGFGREVMKKVQAAPGPVPARGIAMADPRWIGSGRTIYDNKGNPVRQYEPFFSTTPEYESEPSVVEWGVTPVLHYDPIGRLVRTEFPDGTVTKVVFAAWREETWDPNDSVLGSAWLAQMQAGTSAQQRAAALASQHASTPNVADLDPLGRAFRRVADNGAGDLRVTRTTLDVQGNALRMIDPRSIVVSSQTFDLLGRAIRSVSPDAGESRALSDLGNQPVRAWSARGFRHRRSYDALRRPTHVFVAPPDSIAELLVERTVYGESLAAADAVAANARGRVVRVFDSAGAVANVAYDFKGNLLSSARRLSATYRQAPDWAVLASLTDVGALDAAAASRLGSETFTSLVEYDALGRVTSKTTPDGSITVATYNRAGLLQRIDVHVRGATAATPHVADVDYNARGQRERVAYGNGTTTTCGYDEETFRLTGLRTTRDTSGFVLQDLAYTYDAVGNIVQIVDGVSFGNPDVSADSLFEYDALYQLTKATGREHPGQQPTDADTDHLRLDHPDDLQALRRYREDYSYDASGNVTSVAHVPLDGAAGWTRRYSNSTSSNRLLGNSLPGDSPGTFSATYSYDERGNMTAMPHLAAMEWDHNERLQHVARSGGGDVYFTYDGTGQRVAKYYEHGGFLEERIYVGGFELQRKRNRATADVVLARETIHVVDGQVRVALVETKTVDSSVPAFSSTTRTRYQLTNHLSSCSLELDERAAVIAYEEYFVYGGTSFRASDSATDVSAKRYRYCGLERDEETGLSYHVARYYSPWLGRWTAADPIDLAGGTNLYAYCGNNPVCRTDVGGTDWGWLNPKNWCNPFDSDCEVVPVEVAKGFGKAAYYTARDTGARVADMSTMGASAFGKWTGWYDIGYTEWSPEAKNYDPEKSTWQNVSGNVYNNTVGGAVNLAKGIAEGDPESIGGGLFAVVVARSGKGGGGGTNPTITIRVPAVAAAEIPGVGRVPVLVTKPVTVAVPASEAIATANVGSVMMMSGGGGGDGGTGKESGGGGGGIVAKQLGGKTPIPRGTNLAFGLSKFLDKFAASKAAVSVFEAWDKGFLRIAVGDLSVLKGNFTAIVDTFIENGGRIKFDLTGLKKGIDGATTWELRQILGNKRWEAHTDFFRNGKQLTGAALEKALKPWR